MMNKWMGALLAATALIPATAMAQDGNRREARQQQRAERQAMRVQPAREAGNLNMRAERQGGGDRQAIRAQRQAQRQANPGLSDPAQREQFVRQRQAIQAERQTNRADRRINGQPMRSQLQAQGFRQDPQAFRAERRDDRRDFRSERRDDRNALQGGVVTQRQFRADRRDDVRDFRRDRADDRRDFRRDGWQDQRRFDNRPNQRRFFGNNDWRGNDWRGNDWRGNDRGYFGNGGNWNRGWRNDDRYDWRSYRQANRNAFRLPRYYAPQGYGYGYQRFGIGVTLGSILFAQDYWINDPWSYRLPPIDGPYRWVRYYNDAMLVDLETGEVVDVEYDIFW